MARMYFFDTFDKAKASLSINPERNSPTADEVEWIDKQYLRIHGMALELFIVI
jgi:hypothetical protein